MKVTIDRHYEVGSAKVKDNTFLSVDYKYTEVQKNKESGNEVNRFTSNIKAECSQFMHQDLVEAFKKLIPHLAFLTEYAYPKEGDENAFANGTIYEDNRFKGIRVNGVSWKGEGESARIIIMGARVLHSGKVIAINSPLTHFSYAEDNPDVYEFIERLIDDCGVLNQEVSRYVKGEKYGKNPQMDVFAQPEQEEELQKVS